MAQEKLELLALTDKGREDFLEDLRALENIIKDKFIKKQQILKIYQKHDNFYTKLNACGYTFCSAYFLYGFFYAKHIRRFPFTFQLFWLYVVYRIYKFSFIYYLGFNNDFQNILK